jgi:hypothetical protein
MNLEEMDENIRNELVTQLIYGSNEHNRNERGKNEAIGRNNAKMK